MKGLADKRKIRERRSTEDLDYRKQQSEIEGQIRDSRRFRLHSRARTAIRSNPANEIIQRTDILGGARKKPTEVRSEPSLPTRLVLLKDLEETRGSFQGLDLLGSEALALAIFAACWLIDQSRSKHRKMPMLFSAGFWKPWFCDARPSNSGSGRSPVFSMVKPPTLFHWKTIWRRAEDRRNWS